MHHETDDISRSKALIQCPSREPIRSFGKDAIAHRLVLANERDPVAEGVRQLRDLHRQRHGRVLCNRRGQRERARPRLERRVGTWYARHRVHGVACRWERSARLACGLKLMSPEAHGIAEFRESYDACPCWRALTSLSTNSWTLDGWRITG